MDERMDVVAKEGQDLWNHGPNQTQQNRTCPKTNQNGSCKPVPNEKVTSHQHPKKKKKRTTNDKPQTTQPTTNNNNSWSFDETCCECDCGDWGDGCRPKNNNSFPLNTQIGKEKHSGSNSVSIFIRMCVCHLKTIKTLFCHKQFWWKLFAVLFGHQIPLCGFWLQRPCWCPPCSPTHICLVLSSSAPFPSSLCFISPVWLQFTSHPPSLLPQFVCFLLLLLFGCCCLLSYKQGVKEWKNQTDKPFFCFCVFVVFGFLQREYLFNFYLQNTHFIAQTQHPSQQKKAKPKKTKKKQWLERRWSQSQLNHPFAPQSDVQSFEPAVIRTTLPLHPLLPSPSARISSTTTSTPTTPIAASAESATVRRTRPTWQKRFGRFSWMWFPIRFIPTAASTTVSFLAASVSVLAASTKFIFLAPIVNAVSPRFSETCISSVHVTWPTARAATTSEKKQKDGKDQIISFFFCRKNIFWGAIITNKWSILFFGFFSCLFDISVFFFCLWFDFFGLAFCLVLQFFFFCILVWNDISCCRLQNKKKKQKKQGLNWFVVLLFCCFLFLPFFVLMEFLSKFNIFFLFFWILVFFASKKMKNKNKQKKRGIFTNNQKSQNHVTHFFFHEWVWMLSEHSKTKNNHISETFQDSDTVFQPKTPRKQKTGKPKWHKSILIQSVVVRGLLQLVLKSPFPPNTFHNKHNSFDIPHIIVERKNQIRFFWGAPRAACGSKSWETPTTLQHNSVEAHILSQKAFPQGDFPHVLHRTRDEHWWVFPEQQ